MLTKLGLQLAMFAIVAASGTLLNFDPGLSVEVELEGLLVGMSSRRATRLRRKGSRRPSASRLEISAERASCSRFGQERTRRAIEEVESFQYEGSRSFRSDSPWLVAMAERYDSKRSALNCVVFPGDLGEDGYDEAPTPPAELVLGVSSELEFPTLPESALGEVQDDASLELVRGVLIESSCDRIGFTKYKFSSPDIVSKNWQCCRERRSCLIVLSRSPSFGGCAGQLFSMKEFEELSLSTPGLLSMTTSSMVV